MSHPAWGGWIEILKSQPIRSSPYALKREGQICLKSTAGKCEREEYPAQIKKKDKVTTSGLLKRNIVRKGGSRSMKERTYIAIDLKSFYASVECRERGLDPMDTNLVVADESRTDKTICLAVTPSLKSYGISGRGRLFEVKQRVKEANDRRRHNAPGRRLEGSSHFFSRLRANPKLAIDFIIAPPRMAYYMELSLTIDVQCWRTNIPEKLIWKRGK